MECNTQCSMQIEGCMINACLPCTTSSLHARDRRLYVAQHATHTWPIHTMSSEDTVLVSLWLPSVIIGAWPWFAGSTSNTSMRATFIMAVHSRHLSFSLGRSGTTLRQWLNHRRSSPDLKRWCDFLSWGGTEFQIRQMMKCSDSSLAESQHQNNLWNLRPIY